MADSEKSIAGSDEGEVLTVRSQLMAEVGAPESVTCSDKKIYENASDISRREDDISQKGQELPELLRHKIESKATMPCLPYINLIELTTILRDPNMPSQKILQEVADKIMLKSEESESDDGSVSSGGGVVGMKGLLDCIFEVSYMHEDSASSDDDDDSFEKFPREIPCNFCNKIFGSTMTWNTHVLVAHAHQDPSVLNIRRLSSNEADRKEKSHPAQKKHSRLPSKTDCDAKDTKSRHTSSTDTKQTELPHSENVPVRKRPLSKSQQKEPVAGTKPVHKSQKNKESLPKDKKQTYRVPSYDLVRGDEELDRLVGQNKVVEGVLTDQHEAKHAESGPAEKKCKKSLPADDVGKPQEADKSQDSSGQQDNSKAVIVTSNLDVSAKSSSGKIDLSESDHSASKRKTASPLPGTVSPLPTSLNPKRSKRNVAKECSSTSQHKQSDSSASEETPTDERPATKRTSKASSLRSSRGL